MSTSAAVAVDALSEDTSLDEFRTRARSWLQANAAVRPTSERTDPSELGSESVAVFHSLDPPAERRLLEAQAAWQLRKLAAGFGAIRTPARFGGSGLAKEHEVVFREEEARFVTPASTELFRVTLGLVLPTVLEFGTERQRRALVPELLRGSTWVCQLFSEPDAGSDLASLRCSATRAGDSWRITGQKVWTSGAHLAHHGLLIARSDPDAGHRGLTAFLVPLDSPGITIRPIRQMTGGTSFNEVFFDDVVVADELRLGDPGDGWSVTLAVLRYEREVSGETHAEVGGSVERLVDLLHRHGDRHDRRLVDRVVDVYVRTRVLEQHTRRSARAASTAAATVAGSVGKLMWSDNLRRTGEVAATILGARITADTGARGTYCWTEHLLGAPGFRIAGGSDEIQRNIIAERGLGLPREPRPT